MPELTAATLNAITPARGRVVEVRVGWLPRRVHFRGRATHPGAQITPVLVLVATNARGAADIFRVWTGVQVRTRRQRHNRRRPGRLLRATRPEIEPRADAGSKNRCDENRQAYGGARRRRHGEHSLLYQTLPVIVGALAIAFAVIDVDEFLPKVFIAGTDRRRMLQETQPLISSALLDF